MVEYFDRSKISKERTNIFHEANLPALTSCRALYVLRSRIKKNQIERSHIVARASLTLRSDTHLPESEVFVSLHYNSCVLTIGINTVAIMMPFPGVFKMFDSHSRDVFGRPSALGYRVLISVEGIENLGEYFRLTSRSNVVMPFELKVVKCISNNDMQTELSTSVGVVGSTEVAEQHDVNSKTLSVPNFDQSSTGRIIISNISTKQSESSARTRV